MSENATANSGKLRKVKSILISQPPPTNPKNPYAELAKKYDIKIDFRKFVDIEGVTGKEFRKYRVNPDDYSAVIFTSKLAIIHFFRICEETRVAIDPNKKYFCSSEAIALYLQKFIEYRKRKVFFDKEKKGNILYLLDKHKDKETFLFPCADVHKKNIPNHLESNDFKYAEAAIYKVVPSDLSDLTDIFYDMIVFFTPLGIQSVYDNFPDFEQKETRLAAFGPITCKSLEDRTLTVNIKAPSKEAPSMTMAIEQYLKQSNK